MIESGKNLSYSKNYSVLQKIARLHDIKQNEKHPLIFNKKKYVFQTGNTYVVIDEKKQILLSNA